MLLRVLNNGLLLRMLLLDAVLVEVAAVDVCEGAAVVGVVGVVTVDAPGRPGRLG
jgi:hypothetical protein